MPSYQLIGCLVLYTLDGNRRYAFHTYKQFYDHNVCICKVLVHSYVIPLLAMSKQIRSSRPEVFCKIGALRFVTKFTEKHLCESLYFKKMTLVKVFSCEFCEFLRTPFFTEHLRWLLLTNAVSCSSRVEKRWYTLIPCTTKLWRTICLTN